MSGVFRKRYYGRPSGLFAPSKAAAGGGGGSYTITDTLKDNGGGSSYTFSGGGTADIGAAASDRMIAVAIGWRRNSGSYVVNSATIGGISATIATTVNVNNTFHSGAAIFYADVPTGTTADITVTFGNTAFGLWGKVYRVTGLTSNTDHDALNSRVNSGTTPSVSINAPADGILIAVASHVSNTTTATWIGATEDTDEIFDNENFTNADASGLSLETGRTVSAEFTASGDCALAAATWG